MQAKLIAFNQISEYEEAEKFEAQLKLLGYQRRGDY